MVKRWVGYMTRIHNEGTDTAFHGEFVVASDYDALEAKYARLVKFIEEARHALNAPYDFPIQPVEPPTQPG